MKSTALTFIYVLASTVLIAWGLSWLVSPITNTSTVAYNLESAKEYEQLAQDLRSGKRELSGEEGALLLERISSDYTAVGETFENLSDSAQRGIKFILWIALFQAVLLFGVLREWRKCNKSSKKDALRRASS